MAAPAEPERIGSVTREHYQKSTRVPSQWDM